MYHGTSFKTPQDGLNDAGTHIPMIVRQTGKIQAGAVVGDLIDIVDWFPTICELAGVELAAKSSHDGRVRMLRATAIP